ncbi:MAG: response regulator transcription factor [Cyclobacteriaceae bacterium]
MFKKKLIIIEDNEDLRRSYELIINGSDKFAVKATYESGEAAVQEVRKIQPDLALVDLELPGINGIETIKRIKEISPHTEAIILTMYEDPDLVFDSLRAGATGYITKSADFMELINALEDILKGGAPMSSRIARMVIGKFHINPNSPLTDRETDVLRLIAEGRSYSQISEELFIAKETVKSHTKNIYTKLKVNTKSAVISKAKGDNLI